MAMQESPDLVIEATLEQDADVLPYQCRSLPTENGKARVAGGENFT
jgi:hypothetical protein